MGIRNDSGVRKVRRKGGRPRWVIDFLWVDKDGRQRRYRRDARVQARESAMLEARELRDRALRLGTLDVRPATPTFREFVDGAFKALIMPRFRPATRVRYEALLRQGLLDHVGAMRLDAIGPDAVHSFAATLAKRGVQMKGPVMLLRTVLKAATDLELLSVMPRIPRVWTESRKLPDSPSQGDVDRMLVSASGWLRVAIALAAYGGLRSGEVRALEVRDVDLANNCILVRHAMSEDEQQSTKSGHDRAVPVASILRPFLEEALRGKLPKAHVVTTTTGTMPTRQAILTRLNRLEEALGLRAWSFHALRHFFCTTLVRTGASIEAVRVLAGHSALAVTQRYVHATGAELTDAVGRFKTGSGN